MLVIIMIYKKSIKKPNITETKREAILNAAFEEFSKDLYDKVSVFKIAKRAGISRALFYCYFPNKTELYKTILNSVKEKLLQNISFEAGSDPIIYAPQIFKYFSKFKNTNYQGFYEKVFVNMTPDTFNTFLSPLQSDCNLSEFKDYFNLSNYKINSDDEFLVVVQMLLFSLCVNMTSYYKNQSTLQQAKLNFFNSIEYIKFGIAKD